MRPSATQARVWPRSRARSKEACGGVEVAQGELDPAELVGEAADVGGARHRLEAGRERGCGVDLVRVAAGARRLRGRGGRRPRGRRGRARGRARPPPGSAPPAATVKLSPPSAGAPGAGLVGERREGAGGQPGLAGGVDAAAVVEIDEEAAVRGRRGDADRRVGGQAEGGDEGRADADLLIEPRGQGDRRAPAGSGGRCRRRRLRHRLAQPRAPVAAFGRRRGARSAAGRPKDTDCTRVELSQGTCSPLGARRRPAGAPPRGGCRSARSGVRARLVDEGGGEGAVRPGAVVGVRARRGGEGEERVDRRGQDVEAVARLARGAGDVGEDQGAGEGVRRGSCRG